MYQSTSVVRDLSDKIGQILGDWHVYSEKKKNGGKKEGKKKVGLQVDLHVEFVGSVIYPREMRRLHDGYCTLL